VLPGETAKQNGGVRPLLGGEGPLYRAVKVLGLVKASDLAQTGTFRLVTLLDLIFSFNLHEMGRHYSSSGIGMV
jgi:hypothetical protein